MVTNQNENKIDKECVNLVYMLNTLDGIATTESCCGHFKSPYRIFFLCNSFNTIGMLYRCVDKRYTDCNWIIEVHCSDNIPTNGFLLTSIKTFESEIEMISSVNKLISNITYWNSEKYKDYFKSIISIDTYKLIKPTN